MAAQGMWRRWPKCREVLWPSHRWQEREIRPLCRRFSIETNEMGKRFPWTLLGSLAVGFSLGYLLSRHRENELAGNRSLTVAAKTKFQDGVNSADSGSPPRSATFNFIADAVEKAAPAVVYIEITGRRAGFGFMGHTGPTSSGSGFIVTEDGMLLTNAHVVENAAKVTVKLKDGREFSGIVVDLDFENDLAVVQLESDKVQTYLKFTFLGLRCF